MTVEKEKSRLAMEKNYPHFRGHLQQLIGKLGQEIPDTMSEFNKLHKTALKNGALSTHIKELIILGIAISARCEGCIAFHVHDALEAGATRQEIAETIGVALLMGGGPSLAFGCIALEALEQFEQKCC